VTEDDERDEGPSPSELRASRHAFEEAKAEAASGSVQGLPAIDFATFVLSLSHSAFLHFGDAPDPSTGTVSVNLPMARQTIDLLALLEKKTRGNLTGEEERLLEQVLYDLRMRYVEVSKSQ
jgi:hypothetical protein